MSGRIENGKARVVFIGAGEFACPILRHLGNHSGVELLAVVTQPDRPRGRRLKRASCPARAIAEALGKPVLTPERIGAPEIVDRLQQLAPDFFVVVDYGQFLPRRLLEIPRLCAVNIHPSLLPRYRGAAPIQWAIARGDRETGVSILYITQRMDAGNILLQDKIAIRRGETALTLAPRLAERATVLVDRLLDRFTRGCPPGRPQDESAVTFAPKLTKKDGHVDWTQPAETIRNRVRGFQPWPGCYTEAPAGSGRMLRLIEVETEPGAGTPGALLPPDGGEPRVAAGSGVVRLLTVQPEARKPMPGSAWACGYARKPDFRMG